MPYRLERAFFRLSPPCVVVLPAGRERSESGVPIVLVVGYMLYQRRFMGVERKDIRKVDKGDDSLLETAGRPGVAGDEG